MVAALQDNETSVNRKRMLLTHRDAAGCVAQGSSLRVHTVRAVIATGRVARVLNVATHARANGVVALAPLTPPVWTSPSAPSFTADSPWSAAFAGESHDSALLDLPTRDHADMPTRCRSLTPRSCA